MITWHKYDPDIFRISYCSADATFDHVFAFIATNKDNTMECHAFLCPKRKMAQAATLTIAQAFNLAFECWQREKEKRKKEKSRESEPGCCCGCERKEENRLVGPEEAGRKECEVRSPRQEVQEAREGGKEERLLIDLSSPGDGLQEVDWEDVRLVVPRQGWTQFQEEEEQTFTLSVSSLHLLLLLTALLAASPAGRPWPCCVTSRPGPTPWTWGPSPAPPPSITPPWPVP
jgi:hypothetical protein